MSWPTIIIPSMESPFPAYKRGYTLFSACHLPEKPTVFGIGERTQDIYNADILDDILAQGLSLPATFEEGSRERRSAASIRLRCYSRPRSVKSITR